MKASQRNAKKLKTVNNERQKKIKSTERMTVFSLCIFCWVIFANITNLGFCRDNSEIVLCCQFYIFLSVAKCNDYSIFIFLIVLVEGSLIASHY